MYRAFPATTDAGKLSQPAGSTIYYFVIKLFNIMIKLYIYIYIALINTHHVGFTVKLFTRVQWKIIND